MIESAAFTPDGKYIMTGTKKRVFLWDFESLTILKEFKGNDSPTWIMCYLAKSNAIAGTAENNTVRVWDIEATQKKFQ
ncbi:unnamed protein product [Blepharisma stoltei]|uniref:Uncharacterized protein n=1 Tax=Blepharisma stoltei TaxID=1481888 RepID=A0AAU9JEB8_9CILI|nr:unnamed protein product [Blepharisma stoltei]